MKQTLPGINIQFPISQLILSGEKTVETRTYSIPKQYLNTPLFLIETPGSNGKFKSRIAGVIKFGSSNKYKNKTAFRNDFERHKVEVGSNWDWSEDPKWGWEITFVQKFENPIPLLSKKGIRFTRSITANIS